MKNTTREASENVDHYLLSLLIVLNAIILEKSITMSPSAYWWLLISVPLLIFAFFRTGANISN
jgi:hypothetical protein